MRISAVILVAVVAAMLVASLAFAQYPSAPGQPPNELLFPSGAIPMAGATTASSCLQTNGSSTQFILGSCGGSSSFPNGNIPQIAGYSGANAGEAETVSGDCTFSRLGANSYGITCNGIHGTPFPTATLAGNILIDQGSASPFADVTMGGDCTITGAGTITCLKVNGAVFGQLATASAPLIVALGGVGTASLTSNSLLVGKGTGAVAEVTPTLAGNFVVDQGSASPFADVAMSGDCTVTATGAITCTKSNGTAFAGAAFVGVPLAVASGGVGTTSLTSNSLIYGKGTSAVAEVTPTLAGNFVVDQGSASPFADVAMSGDCTVTATGAITCLKTNGVAFGSMATIVVPFNGSSVISSVSIQPSSIATVVAAGSCSNCSVTVAGSGQVTAYSSGSAASLPTATLAGNFVVDQGSASPYADVTMGGDCTLTSAGTITCLKVNGAVFGPLATASIPVLVSQGGTGYTTLIKNALLMGNAGSAVASVTPTLGGNFIVDQGSASPFADVTMSGDCTVTGAGAITCLKSNGTAFAGAAFVGVPVTVPNGGVGTANLTSNSILLGNGTSAVAEVTPTLAGNVVLDQGSASPFADVTMSQDCTITKGGVITCLKTNNVAFSGLAVAAVPLTVANGGSGANSLVSNAILMGNGNTSPMASITPTLAGNLLIDQGSASPFADVSMSQDCTITKGGVITCTKTQNVAFGNLATAADPLVVAHGGSGASTFPTEGILVAQGNAAAMVVATAGPTGAPFVSNGGAATPIYTAELTIGVGGTSAQAVSGWPVATTMATATSTTGVFVFPAAGFWSTNMIITMSPAATSTYQIYVSTPAFANQILQVVLCQTNKNLALPTFTATAGMTFNEGFSQPVCTPGASGCCDVQFYYDTTTDAYITGYNNGPL